MRLVFLGTGTSFGIPQVGCGCPVCTSTDPRDRRTRVGAIVESDGGTRLLLDTPPELRMQLVANDIDRVDAVLFTHAHADHTHGIDDLRALTSRAKCALPMYGSAETMQRLVDRFGYIFDDEARPLPGTSKPHELAFGPTMKSVQHSGLASVIRWNVSPPIRFVMPSSSERK